MSILNKGCIYWNGSCYKNLERTFLYINLGIYMKEQAGLWIKCDVPYPFSDFVDVEIMKNLVDHATYISKTELATGEEEINLQITTTTLVKILDGLDVDLDDPVNTIQLKKDNSGEVVEVRYDFTSYALYHGRCSSSFQLILSYSNFGNVKEIHDPA